MRFSILTLLLLTALVAAFVALSIRSPGWATIGVFLAFCSYITFRDTTEEYTNLNEVLAGTLVVFVMLLVRVYIFGPGLE